MGSTERARGLAVLVAELRQAEACAATGCAPCRRDVGELRAAIIGRRVRWTWASPGGSVLTVTDAVDGHVTLRGHVGVFDPADLQEVSSDR